jgi:uncharacterized protein (TIGR00251 family)
MQDILFFHMEIKERVFKAIIKPNSRDNEITGFDKDRKAYLVKIKARPEDNKANIELVKFLSKVLGKRVKIKSGFKSREKVIETYK